MFTLKAKYGECKVFTDLVDEETTSQLINLLNQPCSENTQIRIMPDTHAGAGCVIGTTMHIIDKIIPNLVGVDIGCGMYTIKLQEKEVDLPLLDKVIREYIPSGFSIHDTTVSTFEKLNQLIAPVDIDRANKSIGTLGGGNHFIELDKDANDNIWLVIHTGSRHLGIEICKYYQDLAYKTLCKLNAKNETKKLIDQLKTENRQSEIQNAIKELKAKMPTISRDLAYIEDNNMPDYLHDMEIAQAYACLNRQTIADTILYRMDLHIDTSFQTIHNYIDLDKMILRKGAVSAKKDELLIIPMNMRDGSLICKGKGNADWNESAPHGAGRIMSRSQARQKISVEEYKKSMANIFSSSVNATTIDEAPMVYKPMQSIIDNIKDTVDIIDIIKPIYNFKANET